MPASYQGQLHHQAQPPQQRHQQQFQGQQHAVPIYYDSSVSPQQQPGQHQMSTQGFSQPPRPGVISSPATSAYLARLQVRPSNPGNGAGH